MTKMTPLRQTLLIAALLLLVGCGLFRSPPQETSAPPTATIRPTAIGTPPGTSPPAVATPEPGPVTLTLWTTEDYAPTSESEGGARLLEQIQAFQREQEIQIDVILKKRSGTGGLLDFLTTASKAAPAVLPDVITLSDADLYRAAQAGLLQPLDDLVSPELLEDQFDFATSLTQLGGATMGVLYQADLQHVVYDSTQLQEPPLTWQELYSSTAPFVFSPAAPGDGVNAAILIQYLALGGGLTDQDDQPALEVEPLTEALTMFAQGEQADVIPRTVLGLTDATTAWATFRIGEAGMVQVPASIYLAERAGLSNAGFGPVPLREPGGFSVGRGWALAVVTQDPERQKLAAALIEHLLAAENSGVWSQAAHRLPTRHAAFDAWPEDDPYLPFIRDLMSNAVAAPNPNLAAPMGGPLAQALSDVLGGRASPGEAAEAAAAAVTGEP